MNKWGPAECRNRLDEIVGWLVEQIEKHQWTFTVTDDAGKVVKSHPDKPPWMIRLARLMLKVPVGETAVRWRCAGMVTTAIEAAEDAIAEAKANAPPPVDVMYPLSSGSAWGDNELRYSLRSLEQYATNLGRVFVVGEKPPWLTGVVHIPMADPDGQNKDANIINKVRAAIRAGISKRFIRASDDQFFCAPVDLATLPVTHAADNAVGKHTRWWHRVQHTFDYLKARGFPTIFYDTHLPQPHDAELFEKAVHGVPYDRSPGFAVNTLTLNQYPGIISVPAGSAKGRLMEGYSDGALTGSDALARHLEVEFSTPSRFEIPFERPARLTASSCLRGIVTLAGGPVYSLNAYLGCRLLRDLGCTLPVEWCYLGQEMSVAWLELIRATISNVRLIDLGGGRNNTQGRGGWQAKVEAILRSEFEELLFLDSDCHPMRDPSYLFDHPLFQKHDCILWPDIRSFKPGLQSAIQAHHGVAVRGREVESGQMLVRPAKCLGLLEKARAINRASGASYKYLHGDKDTFLIGALQSGDSFAMNPHNPRRGLCCGRFLLQHDLDGEPLFAHLTGGKWKPGEPSTIKGVDYRHKAQVTEYYRQAMRSDALLDWRRIMTEAPPMRVRDTFSAAEALRIIQDDSYKIRPMMGHRVTVRWIVDVGGNAGAFTIAAASAFPGSTILCIEPDPELMDDIRWNTRNCQATIHYVEAACVGVDVREVEFIRVPESRAASHVLGRKVVGDAGGGSRLLVPAVQLSSLLVGHGFESLDILKIDAEGVEAEILADLDATGWLEKTHWIRGEWHGREQLPIISKALNRTHVLSLEESEHNGEMIAHNKADA